MGAVEEVMDELRFQEHLKKLSELPLRQKKELWERVRAPEIFLEDLQRIFDVDGDYD